MPEDSVKLFIQDFGFFLSNSQKISNLAQFAKKKKNPHELRLMFGNSLTKRIE